MSELPVDEKDAQEGYYAVKDRWSVCTRCDLVSEASDHICSSANCSSLRRVDRHNVVFKNLQRRSTVAENKLYVRSEDGHVVLAFEGELSFLPRITIPNYVDAPAKDIAEHMMALWNENAKKIEKEGETMTKYPVVKMKELRNYKIGDVVHLKKNGKLVEIAKYTSYTGSCKRCVFGDQCRYGGELDYKTGCGGIGGNSVYFKPVEE